MNFEHVISAPGADPIEVESWFPVEPARVFRAFTEPDRIRQWFGRAPGDVKTAEIDLRPGGSWMFLKHPEPDGRIWGFTGDYVEIDAPQRLVFTWRGYSRRPGEDPELAPVSTVEVTFRQEGRGTAVRVRHAGLPSEAARGGVGFGWEASMKSLVALLGESWRG